MTKQSFLRSHMSHVLYWSKGIKSVSEVRAYVKISLSGHYYTTLAWRLPLHEGHKTITYFGWNYFLVDEKTWTCGPTALILHLIGSLLVSLQHRLLTPSSGGFLSGDKKRWLFLDRSSWIKIFFHLYLKHLLYYTNHNYLLFEILYDKFSHSMNWNLINILVRNVYLVFYWMFLKIEYNIFT